MSKTLYSIKTNPADAPQLRSASSVDLINATGLLGQWFHDYATMHASQEIKPYLKQFMDDAYGFGLYEMTGGQVGEDGVYRFPEDPELPPLVKMTVAATGEVMYVYQHGIVAFVHGDTTFVTRMD